jgi:hypothetical protein
MRKFKFLIILLVCFKVSSAQELKAKITIISNQVGSNVNQRIFRTLQASLHNFINTRKWTTDKFEPNERIECQFLFNLQPTDDVNVFSASLTVQAARPVFNTSYLSPIINFKDDNVIFKYVEFQQLEFNENRVTGTDALVSNLTAVMAYYAYMIIAFDYGSFSLHGGDPYFQKAQNIVNNAPDGRGISGWKAFDGPRNRYWLVANMLSGRYAVMHDVYYNYYRLGMDKLYEDENASRVEVMNVLNLLNNFNTENPNTMINQFFFQGKSTELVKIFSKAPPQDKIRASELLQKLDITNATKYKDELK